MPPFFGIVAAAAGVAAGAVATALFGPQIAHNARPAAKTALKLALLTLHEARIRGAEMAEAVEDLYVEAKAEAVAEAIAATLAAAQAKAAAAEAAAAASAAASAEPAGAPRRAASARKRAAVKRSPQT
jgi:hypothetical protein